MNIDHAKYFLNLSQTQHIAKSSKLLNISPTAISHGISKLEDEFGVKLTTKVGRNIILTDAGLEFARKIRPILENIELIKESISEEVISQGKYSLAITHSLFPFLMNNKLKNRIDSLENTELEIYSHRSADVIDLILTGKIDLGFCYSALTHPDLTQKKIYSGNLIFVTNKKNNINKLSYKEKVQFLNDIPAMGAKAFKGIENCENHPIFKKLNIKPTYKYIVDSYDLQLPILSEKNSWAFIPDIYLNSPHWKKIEKIDLGELKSTEYSISTVWNKNRKPLALYKEIIDYFERNLKNLSSS